MHDGKRHGNNIHSIDGEISGWANTFASEPDPEDRDDDDMNPILNFTAIQPDANPVVNPETKVNEEPNQSPPRKSSKKQ